MLSFFHTNNSIKDWSSIIELTHSNNFHSLSWSLKKVGHLGFVEVFSRRMNRNNWAVKTAIHNFRFLGDLPWYKTILGKNSRRLHKNEDKYLFVNSFSHKIYVLRSLLLGLFGKLLNCSGFQLATLDDFSISSIESIL